MVGANLRITDAGVQPARYREQAPGKKEKSKVHTVVCNVR